MLNKRVAQGKQCPALLTPVLCKSSPSNKLESTLCTGISGLLRQVLHLHVLDQVALVPDHLVTNQAEVLPRGHKLALIMDERVRLGHSCGEADLWVFGFFGFVFGSGVRHNLGNFRLTNMLLLCSTREDSLKGRVGAYLC